MSRWQLSPSYPQELPEKIPGYSRIFYQLLYNRGLYSQKQIDEFLNPDYTQDLHDPFLFNEMEKAVKRIFEAIKKQETILIYGDYDADGVTASAVLEKSLFRVGAPLVEVYIPHRTKDGYGLHAGIAKEIKEKNISLVITVDNGITAFEGAEKLKELGVDLIITDHHLPLEKLPTALAIINPSIPTEKYPFKKLAGVGVAFKLAQALFKINGDYDQYEAFEKWLLDLVAIGTIGDVSLILGENRTLVKYGLLVLNKTKRLGLREMMQTANLDNGVNLQEDIPLGSQLYDLTVRNVAFQVVPRLNAAGRIDHALNAFKLLSTEDPVEALALAGDVHQKNLERQKIADLILKNVLEMMGEITSDDKILVAASKEWNAGVVGLVCGKLKDKYNRPVILFNQDGDIFKGSARSIEEFNLVENFEICAEFLDRFGGHKLAAGLTINGKSNFNKFKKKIEKLANEKIKAEYLIPTIKIEASCKLADLNWELIDELEKFEPFAEGNPQPLFLLKDVLIEHIELVGKNKNSLKFLISQQEEKRKAISFGTATDWQDKIKIGQTVDMIVDFGVNQWNGNRELQVGVVDFKTIS